MLKKELAKLLDISPAMVSRLSKQGMPVDTLERAQRWRKRHLEPGRVKGSRFDPNAASCEIKAEAPTVSLLLVARQAITTNAALANAADADFDAVELLEPIRVMLRQLPANAAPRMSLRVWLALVDWVLSEKSTLRHATDLESLLDPHEFAARVATLPDGREWLTLACDREEFSVFGLPEYDESEPADCLAGTHHIGDEGGN